MKELIDYRTPRVILEEKEVSEGIDKVLDTLMEREKKVLIARWYEDKTFAAIGKEFGVCAARIQQIERKGLRKLRHESRFKMLVEFTGLEWLKEINETDIEMAIAYSHSQRS